MDIMSQMKKKGKPVADHVAKAKMGVLKEIHDMAMDDIGSDVKGLKKVTVASDDKEGLKKGLQKAEDMVGDKDESSEEEAMESPEEEASEDDAGKEDEKMVEDVINHEVDEDKMSPEEIDELIKLLQEKKAQL